MTRPSSKRRQIPAAQRFWPKVHKTSKCWFWLAHRGKGGYGLFYDGERIVTAHRYSYRLNKGPIPRGKMVCHTCDTRSCVRPAHLWLGTMRENFQDAIQKGRIWTGLRGPYGPRKKKP